MEVDKQTWERFSEACKKMGCSAEEAAASIVKFTRSVVNMVISSYPHKRSRHLAVYGKGRTRRKNINRMKKWWLRQAKNAKNEVD